MTARRPRPIAPLLLVTSLLLLLPWPIAGQTTGETVPVSPPPLEACFAPGTPDSVVEQHRARRTWAQLTSLQDRSTRHQLSDRWTCTATNGCGLSQGDPVTLTWSIVPDGTSIYGFNGEATAPSNLQSWLNGIYGTQETWLAIFQQVFDRWAELTGLTYVYESADDGAAMTQFSVPGGSLGVRGDIRIAAHLIDDDWGVLAYNFFPDTGDMVLDSADAFFDSTGNNSLGLRNVFAHEHGHGLGMSHVCPVDQTKLMEPYVSSAFDGPQHDDILAGNRGYGDRFETADSPGTAKNLGTLTSVDLSDLSIDDNSDADYYSFTVAPGSNLSVTVTPIGFTYLQGPQCVAGSSYNTKDNHDLSLTVLGSNGTTVLASVDSRSAGLEETLTNLALTEGTGPYYAVIEGSGANEAQLYRLALTVGDQLMIFEDSFESGNTDAWN